MSFVEDIRLVQRVLRKLCMCSFLRCTLHLVGLIILSKESMCFCGYLRCCLCHRQCYLPGGGRGHVLGKGENRWLYEKRN